MRYPTHHSLLDRLPPETCARLWPVMHPVKLEADQVLFEAGHAVAWVYFPLTALVDELLPQADASDLLLRHVDTHAIAGSCALGDPSPTRTARVSRAGDAYRIAYNDFVRAMDEVPAFRELVLQDAARACLAPELT